MTASTTKSQLAFELPKLSYVDASLEDPILPPLEQPHGLRHWLASRKAAWRAGRMERAAMAELATMTDRELADVGLNRGDMGRLFTPEFRQDVDHRSRR